MNIDGLRRENRKFTAETMVVAIKPMTQARIVLAGTSLDPNISTDGLDAV